MKFSLVFVLFFSICSFAQTDTLTIVSYNLLNFPDGRNDCGANITVDNRADTLRKIMGYLKPDIFVACEIQNSAGADSVLTRSLNVYGNANYAMAEFTASSSLNNSMYYNTDKLTLKDHFLVSTSPRVIDHYVLYVNDPNLSVFFDTTFVEVYMCHLKAGSGGTNEALRAEQTELLMDYIAARPLDRNHFVCGDLNVYSSNEPGYVNLVSGPFGLVDPINAPGSWNNNSSFSAIHTQSTRNNQNLDCGSQGGLDDRFDQILVSENVLLGSDSLRYLVNSYDAVGNDGNHFNSNLLASPVNTQYPDSVVRALYFMSDHLPVALKAVVTFPTSNGLALNPSVQSVSCFGGSDGEATITPNAGQPPYTYLWDVAAGNQTTATASNLTSGIYCVQVTDNLGEEDNYCVYVSQADDLSYSIFPQPDNGDCSGSAALVLGGGVPPFEVTWNDPMNQTGPFAEGLCGGLYEVTVVDANGCTHSIIVEISGGTNSLNAPSLSDISLFPNPAEQLISLTGIPKGWKTITCINPMGKMVELPIEQHNEGVLTLNVAMLKKGVYYLQIKWLDRHEVLRFVRN